MALCKRTLPAGTPLTLNGLPITLEAEVEVSADAMDWALLDQAELVQELEAARAEIERLRQTKPFIMPIPPEVEMDEDASTLNLSAMRES